MRLHQVSYDANGSMRYPDHQERADDSVLTGYLDEARDLFAQHEDCGTVCDDPAQRVSADFEALRWFELPESCLHGPGGRRLAGVVRTG